MTRQWNSCPALSSATPAHRTWSSILLAIILTTILRRLCTHFLVVFLQGSQIFTSLRELSLLHTLTHVPMHKGALGIHEVELVIDSGKHFCNACAVGDHAHSPLHLRKITARHNGGRLIVDAALKASGAPVNELDCPLGLDGCYSSVHILGHHITSVHQATGHVLSMSRITFRHHGRRLKCWVGDFRNWQLFMIRLLCRYDRCIRWQHEVDSWVRHQVRLELRHIDVKSSIEAQGSG